MTDSTGQIIPDEEVETTRILLKKTMEAAVNPGGLPIFKQEGCVSPELSDQWSIFASRTLIRILHRGLGDTEALVLSSGLIGLSRVDYEKISAWRNARKDPTKSPAELERERIAQKEAETKPEVKPNA